jgi:hypothetical protein
MWTGTTIALCVFGVPALLWPLAVAWPHGTGSVRNLPTSWGPHHNVAWRAALPGSGVSCRSCGATSCS